MTSVKMPEIHVIGVRHQTEFGEAKTPYGKKIYNVYPLFKIVKKENAESLGVEGTLEVEGKTHPRDRFKLALINHGNRYSKQLSSQDAGKRFRLVKLEDSPADRAIQDLQDITLTALEDPFSTIIPGILWDSYIDRLRKSAAENPGEPNREILLGLVKKVAPFVKRKEENLKLLNSALCGLRSRTLIENARAKGLTHIMTGMVHAADLEGEPGTRVTYLQIPGVSHEEVKGLTFEVQSAYAQLHDFVHELRDYARNHPVQREWLVRRH